MPYKKNKTVFKKSLINLCLIFFVLFTSSCNTKNKSHCFYILFDNVEGLDSKSIITSKGLKIGEIKEMKLYRGKVIVKIKVKNNIEISKKSIFLIRERGLLNKCIDVENIDVDKVFIKDNDTLIGFVENKENLLEKISKFGEK